MPTGTLIKVWRMATYCLKKLIMSQWTRKWTEVAMNLYGQVPLGTISYNHGKTSQ